MKRLALHLHRPVIFILASAITFILVFACFIDFRMQVDGYIEDDMYGQMEAIQNNSVQILRNEMSHLKNMTASAAVLLSRSEIVEDDQIVAALTDYAESSSIVRIIFVTLDGHVYTSHIGYLGQTLENLTIDEIPIAEITEPIFSQPTYVPELDEVVFGAVAPVTMGEKEGVLISSYNIEAFARLLESKFIDGSANIGIVNNKGEVVVGQKGDEFGYNIFEPLKKIEFEHSSAEQMETDMRNGDSGFAIYAVNGVARYCTYAPVELNNWYVVSTVKEDVLRAKLEGLEKYGIQLTVKLVIIMLAFLLVIGRIWMQEQRRIRLILEQAAMLDGLTGVYNRKTAEDLVDRSLQTARDPADRTLLVIDLDDFKLVNDRNGHLFGDKVLKVCAEKLQAAFGKVGIVGRIGGDEFVVFLDQVRDYEYIEKKIQDIIDSFYVTADNGEPIKISLSVGSARTGTDGDTFLKLYQKADAAMYRAKQKGKARIER